MRILSVILPLLVVTAVFIAPLQMGCCMSEKTAPIQQVQEQPSSCCTMKITQSVTQSSHSTDQPLAPCQPQRNDCPRCTRTVMSHHSCDADQLVISQPIELPTQADCFVLALNTLTLNQPLAQSQPWQAADNLISSAPARTLCAQHCLLTV
ncbi:MAG: hypothetical protein ACF8OB_01250 [Phycisphaeraceae bacterium JB051]